FSSHLFLSSSPLTSSYPLIYLSICLLRESKLSQQPTPSPPTEMQI
ncbi:unnamed protein product, partial [Brassica rapa subsp. narinosa]